MLLRARLIVLWTLEKFNWFFLHVQLARGRRKWGSQNLKLHGIDTYVYMSNWMAMCSSCACYAMVMAEAIYFGKVAVLCVMIMLPKHAGCGLAFNIVIVLLVTIFGLSCTCEMSTQ